MSKASARVIIGRIEAAEPSSPIAVFKAGDVLDGMFASTVDCAKRLRHKDSNLVGVFNRKMDLKEVRTALNKAELSLFAKNTGGTI